MPVRLDVPWHDLSEAERQLVVEGDGDFEGIRGFFRGLERKKYKVHVRVFLSRYRGYLTCPDCGGTRLRPRGARRARRRPDDRPVSALTVQAGDRLLRALALTRPPNRGRREGAAGDPAAAGIPDRRRTRLPDARPLSSTLSGGESQRINLATSLGSALVDTLYVLDEPSIGLHPRDNERLIAILRQLRDQGNTVIVVEHDADMIRVADHVVDLGLGAGEQGGRVIYRGSFEGLLERPAVAHREVSAR